MRHVLPRKLRAFRTQDGRVPFTEWFESIRDRTTRSRINSRLNAVKSGYFGDVRAVGEGVQELRFHFGAGYRIYFGEGGDTIVLLLCGGDKSSQPRDIERAKTYWREYKERHR